MADDTNYLFGRETIFSAETEVTKDNLVAILKAAFKTHEKNSQEINYLYKYYKGNQPILHRIKKIREEITNKVVENHALEIVDFKKGYVFGEPVQYVLRGDDKTKTKPVALLNELMFAENKTYQDRELAEWFYICGTAYRMILPDSEFDEEPDDSPFELDVLDPRYTFVVYRSDFGKKPLMAVKYISIDDSKDNLYSIYTKDNYYEVTSTGVDSYKITEDKPHVLGSIPIIEYPANPSRLGAFEPVLGLLDALNKITSNRMDGLEQFVQAFMKFINCEIDETDFASLKELGAIKIKGSQGLPADVDLVASELDQSQTQIAKEDLLQMVRLIAGLPDYSASSHARSGGDTGQAVMMRDNWSIAEARGKETETAFITSEKLFLKLAIRIIKEHKAGFDLRLSDIDIKFTRNKTDNFLVKTQGMLGLMEIGVHPRIVLSTGGIFSDPEQVYMESKPYLEKWLEKQVEEKTVVSNNLAPHEDS